MGCRVSEIGRLLKRRTQESRLLHVRPCLPSKRVICSNFLRACTGTITYPTARIYCEGTSVGLPESIGASVGTATLEDFKHCDLIINIGQNSGVTSPRILREYQHARERNVPFIVFNPLRERGHERFTDPQQPLQMITLSETKIATQY